MTSHKPTPRPGPNVNVTLESCDSDIAATFPCPLCAAPLDLRGSRSGKPYCVCNPCGVQLFFRGREGIARLRQMLEEQERLVGGPAAVATPAIAVFNRLELLRAERSELQQRRPLLLTDDDLEQTISAVDRDIERLRAVLAELSTGSKS